MSSTSCDNERQSFAKLSYIVIDNVLAKENLKAWTVLFILRHPVGAWQKPVMITSVYRSMFQRLYFLWTKIIFWKLVERY